MVYPLWEICKEIYDFVFSNKEQESAGATPGPAAPADLVQLKTVET
jgi:hypothetical protein